MLAWKKNQVSEKYMKRKRWVAKGLAKQRKECSFRERKFCLRKEGFDTHLIVNTSRNS